MRYPHKTTMSQADRVSLCEFINELIFLCDYPDYEDSMYGNKILG
jgi:hypothetical protein